MVWITENIFWILIIAGVLNFSAAAFAFSPQRAFKSAFGHELPNDPAVHILARTLGVVVAAVGALLIMAAFDEQARFWVLIFASLGKLVFAGQLIAHGRRYRSSRAYLAAVVDLVMVAIFLIYVAAR